MEVYGGAGDSKRVSPGDFEIGGVCENRDRIRIDGAFGQQVFDAVVGCLADCIINICP